MEEKDKYNDTKIIHKPVVRYGAGGVILRIGDGKQKEVLLIQRSKTDPLMPHQWEFPRGRCDRKIDRSLRDCMVREIKEETGLDVKPIQFIDKTKHVKNGGEEISYCYNYACKMLDPQQEIRLSREHDGYKWVTEVGEVELMVSPEQKNTIQKVLNRDRTIVSYPRPQRTQESKESNLDFYLGSIQEDELREEPITLGATLATAGSALIKVYIAAMLIKLAKDVFKVQFTKIGRKCRDYPGGEKAICVMRAKMKAKESEMSKLKAGVERCSQDKDPEACRRKVSGRLNTIQREVDYMKKRLGELRRAPIVH